MAAKRKAVFRSFEPKKLWQRNHEILNLAALGLPNRAIAEAVGVTPTTVSSTINCALGQEKLNMLRAVRDGETIDVMKEVSKRIPKCLEVVDSVLEEADFRVKMEAVKLVLLDLGGYAAPKRVEGKFLHGHFSHQDIEKVKQRAIEAAQASGLIKG